MSETKNPVRFVSGSWPPEICGVGDFMFNLSSASRLLGVTVNRIRLGRSSLLTAVTLLMGSYFRRDEVVYISYPTEGFGKSLLPFLLAFGARRRIILHIHEYGSKNRYCRFLLRRFKRLSRIFFSNSDDYHRFVRDCGLAADASQLKEWEVIPTPSNIPVIESDHLRSAEKIKVLHFGQIRPNKGLEQLAAVFATIRQRNEFDLVLMGGVPAGYEEYAQSIGDSFRAAGAQVRLNLTPGEISCEFASAHIGVFMFPDGADERRGSLIAAMAHGLLCVTTHSGRTPVFLKDATIGVDNASDNQIEEICVAVEQVSKQLDSYENFLRIDRATDIGIRNSFHGIALKIAKV